MTRISTIIALVVLTQLSSPAWAKPLPGKVNFTIYARGQEVGRSEISITESSDAVVFESTTRVQFTESQSLEMTARTVADPKTYMIREFRFEGQRAGTEMQGEVFAIGDSLFGTVFRDGVEKTDYKISPFDNHLMLEDFIMDHEILIALAHQATGVNPNDYALLFPASLTMTKATVATASTLEVESDTQAAVCKKLVVIIEGSEPYGIYFDEARRLPVYMAFPQTKVEVFLDDFYGDSPISLYRE